MSPITAVGYLASALVLATFWMKTPIRLRQVGIASNVAFFSYGLLAHAIPIAVLHGVLFPLNIWRLNELLQLQSKVQMALAGDFSMEWIRQFASGRTFLKGETIFRRGDVGGDMFYILGGTVRLPDVDVTVGKGSLLGEMAAFSADSTRSMTAQCETDVETLVITSETVSKLFYQDPRFGFYLIRLITRRLEQDVDKLRHLTEERSPC
jgi:CRP/FNR family transcriptional regulator, cyclic AMP receptor protein